MVTVGVEGGYHPMQASSLELDKQGNIVEPHWISEVYVTDQNGTIFAMQTLNPADLEVAQIFVDVPSDATTLTAFEWCNIHG
jgi:desulfoferrodoxin (superoxide reductase-like protein)